MKRTLSIMCTTLLMWSVSAQIKTSEVSIEAIGDVTQIQGKAAVAMSTNPNFNLTVGSNLNNTYTSTPDIASRGIMTHGIGTAPGNLYLHRDDVTISTGDILGALRFSGADGGEQIGAEIRGVSSGSWNPGSPAGDLVFLTNPTGVTEPVERMRINRYGNVGIGTSPANRLTVMVNGVGDDPFNIINSVSAEIFEVGTLGNNQTYFTLSDKDGNTALNYRTDTDRFLIKGYIEQSRESSETSPYTEFLDGTYKVGRISSVSSTDGVGLHIAGRTESGVTTGAPSLILSGYTRDLAADNTYDAAVSVRGYDVSDNSTLQTAPIFRVLNAASSAYISVEADGKVGIGTTSPTEKLHVNGKIRATGQVGWSDFVFYDDYELPTLAEVERHIEEKGHLKDIPSEKEVLEEGIDLTEMDSKLLQKIEELTLYMIELNKKLEAQDGVINDLKEENEQLKSRVLTLEK